MFFVLIYLLLSSDSVDCVAWSWLSVWEVLILSPTRQHKSHEGVLQERAVDEVPEPLEVCEDVVNHRRVGL